MTASKLRLYVSEGGQMRADLTFPVATTASLPNLIPPDVAAQLSARGIDPRAIADRAVAAGFPAGELFNLDTGSKQVRIWLE